MKLPGSLAELIWSCRRWIFALSTPLLQITKGGGLDV
jgi:hypothetical protein